MNPGFRVQPATAAHAAPIYQLIVESDLFQHNLEWPNFVVALTPQGEFIGCGQIKVHADGTHELASIAVQPQWQGRGVGRALIETLLADCTSELYLMSISALKPLYQKFGFEEIGLERMPKYFRRITRMPAMVAEFERVGERIMVMKREAV